MTDTSLTADTPTKVGLFRGILRSAAVPVLSVFTALVIGAIFIALAGYDPLAAYAGLLDGALGDAGGLTQTLVKMTPLVFSGLAVAFAFKGGLFNIGAQGQLLMGSIASAWIGFSLHIDLGNPVLSTVVHVTLALLAGMAGGALWGALPGVLKAYTGAHEVITTIMFNFIASNFVAWLVYAGSPAEGFAPGPLSDGNGIIARTPDILNTAILPVVFDPPGPQALHLGVFLAVIAAVLIGVLVSRTTLGFELRMVGLNPTAARYSGINVKRITILTMMIAGALAGLAGTMQTLGVNHHYEPNQSLGLGFDAITVALLASNNPIGVVPAAFLFGAMDSGSRRMQLNSGVPSEIILVVQALILMFVAADQIIRAIYRVRGEGGIKQALGTGWGQR